MKQTLSKVRLDIANLKDQGWDKSSSMSSNIVGVLAILKEDCAKNLYVHCPNRCLNWAIAKCQKFTAIKKNMLVILSKVSLFFRDGSK